jgi:hypothetical protein
MFSRPAVQISQRSDGPVPEGPGTGPSSSDQDLLSTQNRKM